MAERLHVDAAVVEALEAEQFSNLGPPVYVRGHLHRYAEIVGEPESPLLARYAAMQESLSQPDLTLAPRVLSRRTGESTLRWPLLLFAGSVVLGLLIWFGLSADASP